MDIVLLVMVRQLTLLKLSQPVRSRPERRRIHDEIPTFLISDHFLTILRKVHSPFDPNSNFRQLSKYPP